MNHAVIYRIAAVAFLLMLAPNANAAQKSKAQLTTDINTQLPSSGTGLITAAILRQVLKDMVDSDQQIIAINQQTGITYTFLNSDSGKYVTFNNAAPVAVSLPQAIGDFGSGYSLLIQNLGAGLVTVTPTLSTINGVAGPITVPQNQVVLIISAGLNAYRMITYGLMTSVTCGTGLSGGTITTSGTCSITNTITGQNSVGAATNTPVITFNDRGQLTTVTTAVIAPPFSAVTGQATLAQLPTIATNTILSNIISVGSVPAANTLTSLVDTITSQRGTMLVRGVANWQGLGPCTLGQVPQFGGTGGDITCVSVAGTGTVTTITQGRALVFSSNPITSSGIISADVASVAQFRANTADKLLEPNGVWGAADLVTLTDGATVTPDFATGINFILTLGGNRTLASPTNVKTGQTGVIWIAQDATGSRTISPYGSTWKFAGGTPPTLTTSGGSIDVLAYMCRTTTFCIGSITKDYR